MKNLHSWSTLCLASTVLSVDGHDEYRRTIDAMTCKLVKSWAK
jgi:hypothetical protein